MDKTPLYQQIAEAIRQDVLYNKLEAGDPLPTVRELAETWHCTPGTVQRAYRELARQGIVTSQVGQGTRVAASVPPLQANEPLRQATLIHHADEFLLRMISLGYTPAEVEAAVGITMDRWHALSRPSERMTQNKLRFAGSHDPAISLMASEFSAISPGYGMSVAFTGSLGGLIALARGEADIAGSHLWDEDSDTYNVATVKRLMPGERISLITLAHRRLGLIVQPGNPKHISCLEDLRQWRFVNRQRGAGTRVWLDVMLNRKGIESKYIQGYDDEEPTHSEVARCVAEGRADVGLGIEAAALAANLDFVSLARERYDLIIPHQRWAHPAMEALVLWLSSEDARSMIVGLGGYDVSETGVVHWVGS